MGKVINRAPRIIIGTLLPAVIFAFITSTITALGIHLPHIPVHFGSLPGFMGLILAGWLSAGIQCLCYALLMEYVINPRVQNKHTVLLSSGGLILISTWSVFPIGFPVVLLLIGFLVGCLVGYCLRDMYKYYA